MPTRHQHNFTDLRIQYWSQCQGTPLQVQHHGSRGGGFPSSGSSWGHSKTLSPNQGLWMWLSGRVLTWRLLGLEPSPRGKHRKCLCVRGRPCHIGAAPVVLEGVFYTSGTSQFLSPNICIHLSSTWLSIRMELLKFLLPWSTSHQKRNHSIGVFKTPQMVPSGSWGWEPPSFSSSSQVSFSTAVCGMRHPGPPSWLHSEGNSLGFVSLCVSPLCFVRWRQYPKE